MRIIAGDYKGRKLETPLNNDIRPTTEKVKEAMFSMLLPYTEDAVFCDLFAGTGGLGLEALSRGASFCYFCDRERNSINVIKENISRCKAEEKSRVIQGDYMKALRMIKDKIDVFILDPPYEAGHYEKAITTIDTLDLLRDGGIIVAEHQKHQLLPDVIGRFHKVKEKKYGNTFLSTYEIPLLFETED